MAEKRRHRDTRHTRTPQLTRGTRRGRARRLSVGNFSRLTTSGASEKFEWLAVDDRVPVKSERRDFESNASALTHRLIGHLAGSPTRY
jgi:hypothetical protein